MADGDGCTRATDDKEDSMERALLTVMVAAFLIPAAAAGGGWATVGLAGLPDDVRAGDTWDANITVLRHGRTPTDGAKPVLTIMNTNGERESFAARPAKGIGKYVAHVVFPSPGEWRFSIDNGLAATGYGIDATTTYAPVTIGPSDAGGFPLLPVVLVTVTLAALAGLSAVALRRRTAHEPVPTA
jgi:hypothetical protein